MPCSQSDGFHFLCISLPKHWLQADRQPPCHWTSGVAFIVALNNAMLVFWGGNTQQTVRNLIQETKSPEVIISSLLGGKLISLIGDEDNLAELGLNYI